MLVRYRPDIQGLRALAVLVVVLFHAGFPVPGGFVGVDIFFVISGYVITAMLLREWWATGRVKLGNFYARRFRRLTPALALMVSVTLVISIFLLSPFGPQQTAARTGAGAMLLVANIVIARSTGGYFDAAAETNPLLNTWSLSVEEQFYIVFPVALILCWWVARKFRRLQALPLLVVASIGVVSFLVALLGAMGYYPPRILDFMGFYGMGSRAWEFAAGALLALVVARLTSTPRWLATTAGVLGLILVTSSLWIITQRTPFPGPWTLLPVIGTVLLILAGTAPQNPVSRTLAARPAVALGDLSYSWYLWHWPVIVFATLLWPGSWFAPPIAAAASLAPSVASYRWLETPIRRRPALGRPRFASLLAACVVPPVVVAVVLGVGANRLWGVTPDSRVQALIDANSGRDWSCLNSEKVDSDGGLVLPSQCFANVAASGRPIFLVGDSNAAHYRESVIGAGVELLRPFTEITSGGCPFIDVYVSDSVHQRECRAYYEATLEYLKAQSPGTVVISESGFNWDEDGPWVGSSEATSTNDQSARTSFLTSGMRETVEDLQAGGHEVVLVMPLYRNGVSTLATCTMVSIARGTCDGASIPVSDVPESQMAARDTIATVAAETGATVLDLASLQCAGGVCGSFSGDTALYMDDIHISVAFAESLIPAFSEAIGPANR